MTQETTTTDDGLLSALARFTHGFQWQEAPEVVQRQARLSILDTVGCMVAGADTEEARNLFAVERGLSGKALSSVIGQPEKLDMPGATRANAYFGDIFELNDLTGGHASIAVVPAALAYAEAHGNSGRELAEAVLAGIESVSRVYAAYYPNIKSFEDVGVAPPGIPSTIGTTAALARLAKFDEARTAHALQIAGALAGWCPAEVIFGAGGTVKPMLFGAWPGSVALQAVAYAAAGFTGPANLLESRVGLYSTLASDYDAKQILAPSVWHLAQPRRKQHACCGYIHAAIDAMVRLRNAGVDPGQAARIEVLMPQYVIPVISKGRPPATPNEARFHAEYCIALAAQGVALIRPQHSIHLASHYPDVQDFVAKIQVGAGKHLTHYHQCEVRGFDSAGNTLFSESIAAPKGAPGDPMSDDEVREKFSQLCADRPPQGGVNSYIEQLERLEQLPGCEWIVRRFC